MQSQLLQREHARKKNLNNSGKRQTSPKVSAALLFSGPDQCALTDLGHSFYLFVGMDFFLNTNCIIPFSPQKNPPTPEMESGDKNQITGYTT